MAVNVYEALFIFDSNKYARDASGVSGSIPEMVEQIGGEVLANRLWAEQKLAYPINGHRKGTYWLTYFRSESTKLATFNRLCQLNDGILRHMVVSVEPRLVDVLVSHARGEKQEEQPQAADEKPAPEAKPDKPEEKKVEKVAAETAEA